MSEADDTPLMRQWREIKSQHRDSLVFFRVGDFYELFFEDAEEGSRLLGLTLTSRNNGAAARVPLAGVPAKAPNDPLGFGGILHLVADGHPLPQGNQPPQVFVQRLGRNAGEGHTSLSGRVKRVARSYGCSMKP